MEKFALHCDRECQVMMDWFVLNLPMLALVIGCVCALIPGIPGSAFACFGVLGAVSLGALEGLDSNAQFLILGMATVGSTGQFLAPMVGHQALGGSAGSGTGAVVGALLGSFVLIPGFYWVTALVGAFIGGLMGARRGLFESLRGALGVVLGVICAVLIDLLGVLGIGAVLALWDLSRAIPK